MLSTCLDKDQGFYHSKRQFVEELFVKVQAICINRGEKDTLWAQGAINSTRYDVLNCLKIIKKFLCGKENKFQRESELSGFCIRNPSG